MGATPDFDGLIESWTIALEAEGKASKTIEAYTTGARLLAEYAAKHRASHIEKVTAETVRKWLLSMKDRTESTVLNRYKGARSFFAWCVTEGELDASPFDRVKPPAVHDSHTDMLSDEQLRALLADCEGTDYVSRRDMALIMMLADTGCRVSEVVNLQLDDVDLRAGTAKVTGKGSRPRVVPLGARARQALDRYIRVRRRAKYVDMPWLWLGSNNKGRMTVSGVQQVLRRRGERIGAKIHPHMFRHMFADQWLRAGGGETDLMELAGWRSRQMLTRYAAANRSERAREAHKRLSPLDNL